MKKRVVASSSVQACNFLTSTSTEGDILDSYNGTVLPFLKNVTKNCYLCTVDPSACLTLHLIRNESLQAVRRLKDMFCGKIISSSRHLTGLVSGTPTSILVPLVGDLEVLVDKWFISKGFKEDDIELKKSDHITWYGIIDGCQIHAAFMLLRNELPRQWLAFKWDVIVVQLGKSMMEYRQLARVQNERNKSQYSLHCTIFDLLHGLRMEYDLLYAEALKASRTGGRGVKVSHRLVAQRYDGAEHKTNTTIRQAVGVASRLSRRTIRTIGDVCNQDCSTGISDQLGSSEDTDTISKDNQMDSTDCRLFKDFLCFGTLRAAKAFMNAVVDGKEEAQVNTIFRLKHLCAKKGYKPIHNREVSEQFKYACMAIIEQDKFSAFVEEDH